MKKNGTATTAAAAADADAANDSVCSSSSLVTIHRLDSVESTQDEARKLLLSSKATTSTPYMAISSKYQHSGRGTNGRTWKGKEGNVFLTIVVPMSKIPLGIITLLPLQVGIIIVTTLRRIILEGNHNNDDDNDRRRRYRILSLKWPNDVLIDQKKVAGVLIENERCDRRSTTDNSNNSNNDYYLLVGIGINVLEAPTISKNEGRPSACLQEYCTKLLRNDTADGIVTEIVNELVGWIEQLNTTTRTSKDDDDSSTTTTATIARNIVNTWKQWADLDGKTPQTLRDTGEVVIPIDIQDDGQLLVRQQNTGQERLLMAEYLY